jgi:Tol biopolymer transport system component
MIAFVSKGEAAAAQVWLKNLSHDNPTRITEGEGDAARPRWSPRKDQIVFERTGRGIWSVSPLGGTARRIIEHGRNASFSPDGSHLVFERDREIWTARADGSSQQPLRGTPHRVYLTDASPTFSPDGHWIAFFHAEAGPKGDLWVIPARGGEPRRLTSDVTEGGAPVWTPDGRWIVFSSARAGSFTLWRVPFRGGRAEPVTTGAGEDREPSVSADGRRLIYTNVRNSWSLMLLDPASGRDKELFSRRENLGMPMFSPDGNRIAYFEHIGNDAHLFVVAVDGKDLTQLTHERSQQNIMPAWSQDGASLYFYRMRPSPSFRRLALGGASSIEVAPWVWGKQTAARVDPSGRAAVYTILEASRPAATVVRELSTGQERRLAQAISRPQWSPDSQFVVGSIKERQIMMCPASGESCTVVTAGNRPKWSRDGSQIYFFRATQYPDRFELWSAARDGSKERRISELGPFSEAQIHFDVSSQGHIVWAPYRQNRQELWLADLQ